VQLRVVDDVSQHGVREHEAERLPDADQRSDRHEQHGVLRKEGA
jgi:hypothetical protein